jgi:acetoin utilization protein AcuB
MLVEHVMSTEVVTLPPTAVIAEALQLLEENKIRHIPIINEERQIVGIVSDRDIRDAAPSIFDSEMEETLQKEIQTIMSQPVVTVHPLDFAADTAKIFYDKEFACVPVVSEGKLVGIVTEKDMLYTLIQLTGTHVQSSQINVKIPDRPGMLPEVTRIIGNRKVNIVSVLIYPYKDNPNFKVIAFRIQTMNPVPTIEDLRNAGYELLWPNEDMEPVQ